MSAPRRLLFIRHAETDLAGTFCGHANPPVNPRGLDQIQALLAAIRDQPIDAIYTSDLERAVTTAEALGSALGLVAIEDARLREIHFGDWEGLTWQEVEQRDPACAQQWIDAYPHLPAPGGESFQAFQARVLAAVDQLLTRTSHRLIAVVTHAGVMRVVLTARSGVSEQESWAITKPFCSFFDYTAPHAVAVQP